MSGNSKTVNPIIPTVEEQKSFENLSQVDIIIKQAYIPNTGPHINIDNRLDITADVREGQKLKERIEFERERERERDSRQNKKKLYRGWLSIDQLID